MDTKCQIASEEAPEEVQWLALYTLTGGDITTMQSSYRDGWQLLDGRQLPPVFQRWCTDEAAKSHTVNTITRMRVWEACVDSGRWHLYLATSMEAMTQRTFTLQLSPLKESD